MLQTNVIRRWLTGGVVIAAASFPSVASARFELNDPPSAASRPAQSAIGIPTVQRSGGTAQGGFQWGDAGIGAAGAVVLLGAGGAAAGLARRRRVQRPLVG